MSSKVSDSFLHSACQSCKADARKMLLFIPQGLHRLISLSPCRDALLNMASLSPCPIWTGDSQPPRRQSITPINTYPAQLPTRRRATTLPKTQPPTAPAKITRPLTHKSPSAQKPRKVPSTPRIRSHEPLACVIDPRRFPTFDFGNRGPR